MSKNNETSALIDGLLRMLTIGGAISMGLLAPNAIQALDKPLNRYLDKLDERSREREKRRIIRYMKATGLVKGDYEHGLVITKKGRRRVKKANFENLQIARPESWDKKWRLIFFDIPEENRGARIALTTKLRSLGFKQLQQSVWVYPYPCREELEVVTSAYEVSQYVTYVETSWIDHQEKLIKKFSVLQHPLRK